MSARTSSLVDRVPGAVHHGPDVDVSDATHDSRAVTPGGLFCAVPGRTVDGHTLAADAVAAGAVAVLCERRLDVPVPQLVVPSVRAAMGPIAAAIHGDPASELRMVGVTGTNGKTTVAFLLESAMAAAGWGSGCIGTLGTRLHGTSEPGARTTPEATDLQRILRAMRTRGADGVAMEVSSHGLDLRRVDGIVFDVAVFTNLTQDHLDWHGTMAAYRSAKARLFTPELARHAVILLDAPGGREMRDLVRVPMTTVGEDARADAQVLGRVIGPAGSRAQLRLDGETVELRTTMRGAHNLDNLLAAAVAAIRMGIPSDVVASTLTDVGAPPGRLEPFGGGTDPLVLVDYAHTPDAVAGAVAVGRSLLADDARLLVVLGAGGDRDVEKRALMGAAAASADVLVITDDNPRSEDPAAIRAAVREGASGATATVMEQPGRDVAVARAVADARQGDVVLVLGRGHETHQEVAGMRLPLDDRDLVRAALAARGSAREAGRR